MKSIRFIGALLALISAFSQNSDAQNLPGSLSFNPQASFINATAQSNNSILIADNDLTDGYTSGFDLKDAPAALATSGPTGSAAFQWGEAAKTSAYPHTSALWFRPLAVIDASAEQPFEIGNLFYRNGTIKSNTGATWVDIALTLSFSQPLGQDPVSVVFGSELINTPNTNDPIASADIVSISNLAAPINFTDSSGNRYYLELTFKIDQDTIDGTLSSQNQFRVFEGGTGSATLMGRFTTTPVCIPEPSAALLGTVGILLLIRRRR